MIKFYCFGINDLNEMCFILKKSFLILIVYIFESIFVLDILIWFLIDVLVFSCLWCRIY